MKKKTFIGIASLVVVVTIVVVRMFIPTPTFAPQPAGELTHTYFNDIMGFSVQYPADFTIDDNYTYQGFGPGEEIDGIKFTIPETAATGTNLSRDSYISVEAVPQADVCSADLFFGEKVTVKSITDGGVVYSIASSTGARAGNRYEETVYAFPNSSPCLAVRYFVHYGVFENYPTGTVKEFNRATLLKQFDAIRKTLVLEQ